MNLHVHGGTQAAATSAAREGSGPVRRRIVLASPPERVWVALTRGEQLGAWFGAVVEIDARPGGVLRFMFPDGVERRGVVEAVEPRERLAFRWRPLRIEGGEVEAGLATRVEFSLEGVPDGTRLTVAETPLSTRAVAVEVRP